ncbi:MAG: YibE/F family protein [Desulfobacterales bacterium]|nr:YibE/F family protein [Desulfobacterales bacterium]
MKKNKLILLYSGLLIIIVLMIFLNLMKSDISFEQIEKRALVLAVDNSEVIHSNISSIGNQVLTVKLLEGKYKGEVITAHNSLMGQAELDNIYNAGDKLFVALLEKDDKVIGARAIDLCRQNWELLLFGLFALLLIAYAGKIGLKALFSFMASLYVFWEFLIPGLLAGHNPLFFSSLILLLLSALIIFSIAGFTLKGLAAFVGTISGLFASIGIAIFFGNRMGLLGMTSPYAQTLLISAGLRLNMKEIFYAAIIIGASGAAMDNAMDIAASMAEIKLKKPEIDFRELVKSGFNVGRAVIGTMTTTLLLAYSGGYLTLMMLFMTKNSSYIRMFNYKIVSAEILRIISGSIALVLVAPITAIFAGWIYSYQKNEVLSWLKRIK